MNRTEVGHILIWCLLCQVITVLAITRCDPRSKPPMCYQSCRPKECKCNATERTAYSSCNQTCSGQFCYTDVKMSCIAGQNCTQVCLSGFCDMTCRADNLCTQKAENGAKTMTCSSKECKQDCVDGNCNVMHCSETENCLQTCGKGGCAMNCTETVKKCSRCIANKKCTLECRADVCDQQCSGPAQCIIVNAASLRVLHLPVFVMAFLMLILPWDWTYFY